MGGCTMIPKYERPQSPVAATYADGNNVSNNINDIKWKNFFQDPRLKRCIELALEHNRDLQKAVLEVQKAKAQYQIKEADLLPEISLSGGYTREQAYGVTASDHNASVGITSYELDLFGRIRSSGQAALQEYFSLVETRKSVHISLVAEVASQYLTILEYEAQLQLAKQTLELVGKSREYTEKKVKLGGAPESDIASTDVQVQTARVNIYLYERLLAQSKNTLVELIGEPLPDDMPEGLPLEDQPLMPEIPSGLPSDLIARRPDILAAEHTLLSANADIGAARAAFFPKITLTGSAGAASLELTDLFSQTGAAWKFAPQISVPIFTGGKNKATLESSEITKKIEIANYEKTIQTAFREVSNTLVGRDMYVKQVAAQMTLVDAQQSRYDFAQSKHDNGISDYLDVLTAQQDLYDAQEDLISVRAAKLRNLVMLYKALGGGWE